MLKEFLRRRGAEHSKAAHLFGVGSAEDETQLAPPAPYGSSLKEQAEVDSGYLDVPADVLAARPRTPLTLLDFVAPFCHFFSILMAGKLLSLYFGGDFVTPAAAFISKVALGYGFLRVLLRDYSGRFCSLLRPRKRLGRVGRAILRRRGRRAWLAWYLTQPFWIAAGAGAAVAALGGLVALLRLIWNSLPAPAPAPAPRTAPGGPLFGEESQSAARSIRSIIGVFKYLLFFFGCAFIVAGTFDLIIGRPAASKFIGGFMCISMGAFITIANAVGSSTPPTFPEPLGQ